MSEFGATLARAELPTVRIGGRGQALQIFSEGRLQRFRFAAVGL